MLLCVFTLLPQALRDTYLREEEPGDLATLEQKEEWNKISRSFVLNAFGASAAGEGDNGIPIPKKQVRLSAYHHLQALDNSLQ